GGGVGHGGGLGGVDVGLDYTLGGAATPPEPLLGPDQEVVAPVLGPAGLAALLADRALEPVADDRDAIGLDSERGQIAHGRFRAPLAERQVVLGSPALVAVALDEQEGARIGLEPAGR